MRMRIHGNMKTILGLSLCILLGAALASAAGPNLPAPPAGFTPLPTSPSAKAMKESGISDGIEAEKASDWNCKSAPKTKFGYSWQTLPGGDKTLEIMAKIPQEPAKDAMGSRTEPAGKSKYKNGVLEWQKWTTTMAQTDCPAKLETFHGKWAGYVSGKIIGVSITHIKSKENGQGLLDEYIDKLSKAVAASK